MILRKREEGIVAERSVKGAIGMLRRMFLVAGV